MGTGMLAHDEVSGLGVSGWGVICAFQAKSALMHGLFMLEFSDSPPVLRQIRVLASPVPRYLTDASVERAWVDLGAYCVKKSMEMKWLAPDIMNRITNEFKWAAEDPAWQKELHQICESGNLDELRARLLRLMGKVIDVLPELKIRYVADFDEVVMAEDKEPNAAPAAGANVVRITVSPQSDPLRGAMISALQANDEIFVKIIDQTPRGQALRGQLGGADEDGNLQAVARPFREVRALDDRGNFELSVDLGGDAVGVAEVYHSVKVKTVRTTLTGMAAPVAASQSADDAADDESAAQSPLASWLVVAAAVLVLLFAAWLLKSYTG